MKRDFVLQAMDVLGSHPSFIRMSKLLFKEANATKNFSRQLYQILTSGERGKGGGVGGEGIPLPCTWYVL